MEKKGIKNSNEFKLIILALTLRDCEEKKIHEETYLESPDYVLIVRITAAVITVQLNFCEASWYQLAKFPN